MPFIPYSSPHLQQLFYPKMSQYVLLFEDNPLPQDRKQPKSKQNTQTPASMAEWIALHMSIWQHEIKSHCCQRLVPTVACPLLLA